MNSRSGIGAGRAGDGWRSRWVAHRRRSLALLAAGLLLPAVFLGAASPRVCAAGAAPAREAATTNSTVPTVEEWLNQTVRLRKTVQATTLPGPDGKPAGEIRVGAEVRAIGLVSGKHWVAIELPDGSRAYVPREAIEYESNSTAPAAPVEQQRAATPVQSGASTSATTAPAAAPAEVAHPSSPRYSPRQRAALSAARWNASRMRRHWSWAISASACRALILGRSRISGHSRSGSRRKAISSANPMPGPNDIIV